jgi:micrococcal nuclease
MWNKFIQLRYRWRARAMLGRPVWQSNLRSPGWRVKDALADLRQSFRRRPRPAQLRAVDGWWMTTRNALAVAALFGAALAGHALVYPDSVVSESFAGSGVFGLCAERRLQNCVIDGDTIRYGGAKIRLADIDTPEIFSPKCASEAALGQQATERLLELINAGPFEVVPSGSRDEDRYGRKLRTVERNGRSLGDILVAEGLARPWDGGGRGWCG